MRGLLGICIGVFLYVLILSPSAEADEKSHSDLSFSLRAGAASIDLEADDSMVIGGGIGPGRAKGQEGRLRAVATVLEKPGGGKLSIIACDVLFVTRDLIDPVVEEIEKTCSIPKANVLINATHTHHAPSTAKLHGYDRDELFCRRMQQGIVLAVKKANACLTDATFHFWLGEESSVGQNSRLLLKDNSIYWTGSMDDALRPTGPFDPELPVLAFKDVQGKLLSVLFNHSTHTIGARTIGSRSPGFYGMAAQELEKELGGTFCFLEGASGSTHNLKLSADEMILRTKNAVRDALNEARPHSVLKLTALKHKFTYRVRTFDEAKEESAVSAYCHKRMPPKFADDVAKVFRDMRKEVSPHQGEERTTWIQAILIGDVAIVGVPAEYFTKLGEEIKRKSPFRYTYVAELANDWIGYLPDRKAYELGGYQTWTGLHSLAAPGTGEAVADEAVKMLRKLQK